jgi:hypothetical protein
MVRARLNAHWGDILQPDISSLSLKVSEIDKQNIVKLIVTKKKEVRKNKTEKRLD